MKLIWTQYKSFEDYGKATVKDLMFNKHQNAIILRNIKKRSGKPIDETVRLATVSDGKRNLMIGFQTLPWQMMFFFCENKYNAEVMEFYIGKVIESGWDIHQIMAEETHAKKFAELYAKKTGKTAKNRENLIVYKLGKICADPFPKGTCRKATMDDMNVLPYWGVAFYYECELEDIGKNLDYQYKSYAEKIDNCYLWEVDGRPCSMAFIDEIESDTAKVSGVYTPPYLRGKGYAFGVVKSICQKYESKYKDIMLYADADYPQSNKVYQRIGFKPLFVNAQYEFKGKGEKA